MNKSKLASMVLITTLSSGVFASDVTESAEHEGSQSTYWGLGIGSVLGGIIAGPPGIAIGATLGGAFGWGQEQNEALEIAQQELVEQEALVIDREQALNTQSKRLELANTRIGELKRSNQRQVESLQALRVDLDKKSALLAQSDLENVLAAYTQEVYFERGESQLPLYVDERLSQLAEFLKSYPNVSVTLTGYTDPSGSVTFNQKLSQARAERVRDALLARGVENERMLIQSHGESKAHTAEGDHSNAILDRRVAIEFSQSPMPELLSTQDDQQLAPKAIEETTLAELVQ